MRILHVQLSHLAMPPEHYGGTERVVWSLFQGQQSLGHEVRFLCRKSRALPHNATVYDPSKSMAAQIGDWPDIVHFHWPFEGELHKPFVCTEHGNANRPRSYPVNTVFVSRKHAENHGASCFVYNGLDWRGYGEPGLDTPGGYCHFLGKTKVPSKNVQGAIDIARRAEVALQVLGGNRITLQRNPYICLSPNVQFHGMVGGEKKHKLIKQSAALIAPARWHEPFGLAIIESLFLGAPVLATPYGSLPELVPDPTIGMLSTCYDALAEGARDTQRFDRRACHEWARTKFDMLTMAGAYQQVYERVIAGERLNPVPPRAPHSFTEMLPVVS